MNIKEIKRQIPMPIRSTLRQVADFSRDTLGLLLGQRDPLIPPGRLMFVGAGDFCEVGQEFLRHFIDLAQLKPDEAVLDVGCGVGRMALALTQYLNADARYEGFDIVQKGIEWSQTNISRRHNNFHFTFADVFNANYNPRGKTRTCQYSFPYSDGSFDFVFLTSVFTHMFPDDLEHYLSEIARVTKKGGRCLITFFLLNAESLDLINQKKSSQDFTYVAHRYRTIDLTNPERAIAFDESFVRTLFSRYGFDLQTVRYGSWCGRETYLSYQDIVVATKS